MTRTDLAILGNMGDELEVKIRLDVKQGCSERVDAEEEHETLDVRQRKDRLDRIERERGKQSQDGGANYLL